MLGKRGSRTSGIRRESWRFKWTGTRLIVHLGLYTPAICLDTSLSEHTLVVTVVPTFGSFFDGTTEPAPRLATPRRGGSMKSRTLTLIVAMTFSAALATAVRLTAQEQQEDKKEPHRYTVIDLGTLGGTFATGLGVNNEGWVTGFANLAGDENHHAFLWVNGVKTDLGTLGGPNSVGNSLNARGQVVGNAETSIPDPTGEDPCGNGTMLICPPFLWQKELMTPLATLGGKNGSANGINERGDAVGTA